MIYLDDRMPVPLTHPGKAPWKQWKASPPAEASQVHIIAWPLTRLPAHPMPRNNAEVCREELSVLSHDERGRAMRFAFAPHRTAYVQAHVGMRQVLGTCLGVAAQDVEITAGTWGKPQLAGEAPPVRFNLSHTDGICVLALSVGDMEVGVDIECIKPVEYGVAETHFSSRERADLATLPVSAWLPAFFRCWTRKEAILKAEGVGLRPPLHSFAVSLLPWQPPALLSWQQGSQFTRDWKLHHFAPDESTIGAVATSGPAELDFFRLS